MTTVAATGHHPECSDPEDPLSRYSLISLFPKTFGILSDAPSPYDLGGDLDSLHDRLASAALTNPVQLLDQARAIVEKKSQILNDDIGSRKRRRPGLPSHLRAQRPRFTLKPDFTSQSARNLLANLEFDAGKYDDPDEFFDAYEKFETTKRELEKLAGVVEAPNQSSIARTERPRRPGLSRPRISYNHLFEDITASPARTCQKDHPDTESPLSALQPKEVNSVKLMKNEVTRPTGAENEATIPSDDVFSSILDDLDMDGVDVVDVLQERLQIKTFDVKSLQFPEMQELEPNKAKTPGSDSSKPRRAYMQNMLNKLHSKSPSKRGQATGSLRSNVLSPTPPKSPLNVMNFLRKPLNDPVSPHNRKSSVEGISQPTMRLETYSPDAKRGTYSGFTTSSKLLIPEEVGVALRDSPQTESCAQNAGHLSGKTSCDSCGGEEFNVNIGSIQKDMVKDDDIASLADSESSGSRSKKEDVNPGLSEKNVDVGDRLNVQATARNTVNSANTEDCDASVEMGQKDVDIGSPKQCPRKESGKPIKSLIADKSGHVGKDQEKEKTILPKVRKGKQGGRKKTILPKVRKGKQGGGRKHTVHSRRQPSAAIKNLGVIEGTGAGTSHGNPNEHDELLPEELLADRKKVGTLPRNVGQRKELNRRQSLAEAGTSWCGGVRRSTRIKSRPLEYWRGERFLYGRVHKSLTTVIGIKYTSPGKADDGKSSFKVKSFVSDQYKDLVDLVALH